MDITLRTGDGDSMCGFEISQFVPGEPWLIFAWRGQFNYLNGTYRMASMADMEEVAKTLRVLLPVEQATSVTNEITEMVNGYTSLPVFTDIAATHAQAQALRFLKQEGVVQGNPDGSFAPERRLSRAEFVQVLLRAKKLAQAIQAQSCFTDVAQSAWYAGSVCAAAKEKLISGDDNRGQMFRPTATVNLAEALAGLSRAFGWSVPTAQRTQVWYAPLLVYAQEKGIVVTNSDARTPLTRAAFAELLGRSMAVKQLDLTSFNATTDPYGQLLR